MIKKLLTSFNNLSIWYKLFSSYLLLIGIPFCLFIIINYYVSSNDAEKQAVEYSQKVLNQARSSIEYKTEYIKNVMDVFALNDTVQELLSTPSSYYQDNIGNWTLDSQKFTKLLFSIRSNPDIVAVHLYMKDGLAALKETDEFLSLKDALNTDWYKKMVSREKVFEWFPAKYFPMNTHEKYVSFLRMLPNSQNTYKYDGIIRADLPETNFKSVLDQSAFTKGASAVLINSSNEIISSSETNYLIKPSNISDTVPQDISDIPKNGIWSTKKLKTDTMLIGVQTISKTDWKLVLIIPYKDILGLNAKSRNQMIFALLVIVLLTFPVSYLVAGSATKRIRKLISHMREVEKGNFDVNILSGNNDEIGELTRNYNTMLTKISKLVDEKFLLGKAVKNMELRALQAQINPHFLYNTLDLINWMSMKYKAPKIGLMIDSLSIFYKLSLSKGEDIITLEDELNHIRAYVQIQNMRFENSIQLNIDVPEELYQYKILKITLQPLVENSILHGILEKDEEIGIIKISGALMDNNIILCVEDDGVGIPDEVLSSILFDTSTTETHGYGVRNIHERLKLNFGNEYGLSYRSELGVGTTVEINIPAVK